jgi:hypothetical protein
MVCREDKTVGYVRIVYPEIETYEQTCTTWNMIIIFIDALPNTFIGNAYPPVHCPDQYLHEK